MTIMIAKRWNFGIDNLKGHLHDRGRRESKEI